jgi:nickel superoxide dismutase
MRHAFAILNRLLPTEEASAHCDIPCGIYDPHLAQIGALTVVRMHQLIEGLEAPGGGSPPSQEDRVKFLNSLSRYIAVKEEHAELVKHEVRIIRGDFFKPDNSPANIGELVDGIMKLASKCRQNVDMDAAQQLLAEVQKFAEAFWKAKGVATKRQPSNQAVGEEMVLPAA